MVSIPQLIKSPRKCKKNVFKSPALEKTPQKKVFV